MSLRNALMVAGALFAAMPATAATHVVEAGDYHVVATTETARPGFIRLNIEAQRVAGGAQVGAVLLHAFFLDSEGMILGEAPLARSEANGLTLTAYDPAVKLPEGAKTLAVLAEPTTTLASTGGATAAPATALIPLN
jgi:hypothetical protein